MNFPLIVHRLQVNLATMQMFSPVKGKLRRTHHDGVFVKFAMTERDYSISAKVGYVQVGHREMLCVCVHVHITG